MCLLLGVRQQPGPAAARVMLRDGIQAVGGLFCNKIMSGIVSNKNDSDDSNNSSLCVVVLDGSDAIAFLAAATAARTLTLAEERLPVAFSGVGILFFLQLMFLALSLILAFLWCCCFCCCAKAAAAKAGARLQRLLPGPLLQQLLLWSVPKVLVCC
ncbi:hypothetical protein Emed_006180 [Eimeria media]